MKSSLLVVAALACAAVTACEAQSPLDINHAPPGAGQAFDSAKLDARLTKLEANVARITDILEHHPGAASSPAEFEAGRVDRVEAQIDKVIRFLRSVVPPPEPDAEGTYAVPIGKADPVEGPPDAKVTIVEGFEFLCPFCFKANPTVLQILDKYPNDVRLVSKYLIIHGPDAVLPGMAACAAAKQGKFKEMKAALWAKLFKDVDGRPTSLSHKVEPDNLGELATAAGADLDKLRADIVQSDCKSWIDDSQDVMKPLGATSTPSFFINGRFIGGAQPFEAFDALIKEELAKADDKIKAGVAQADYYAKEIVAKGQKTVKGPLDD